MPATRTLTQYLSPAQVAESLGVNDRTVRRWIAEGRITALRVSERVIRIDPADLDKFLGRPDSAA